MTDFERDAATYALELPRLLVRHGEGAAVLIRSARVVEVFNTEDEAMRAGYARFGAEQPWIVKPLLQADLQGNPPATACRA